MKKLLAVLRAWWTRNIAADAPNESSACVRYAETTAVIHARTPEGPIIPAAKRERLRAEWDRVADAEPVADEVRAI